MRMFFAFGSAATVGSLAMHKRMPMTEAHTQGRNPLTLNHWEQSKAAASRTLLIRIFRPSVSKSELRTPTVD